MTTQQKSITQFGDVLREWRGRRRLSQLELSLLSATSARHISFLEKGRSNPSREMIQKLAACLDVMPSEVNAAMVLAGFAPIYPKASLDDKSVATLRSAVDVMLDNHMPWPAFACDAAWNVLLQNKAATRILQLLGAANTDNLIAVTLAADSPQGTIINWPDVARLMLQRLNAEQLLKPDDQVLQAVREKLKNHPRIEEGVKGGESTLDVVVPIKLRDGDRVLSFISMIAQFGAVQEVTYSDIHIELFFPEDADTMDWLQAID